MSLCRRVSAPPAIAAQDILAQIRSGEPLNYDNVTIAGQLDLGLELGLSSNRYELPTLASKDQ